MNIALFLSSDGIALAHRQPAGHWAMIGETAYDVPDLSAALADLRALAEEREGDGFETLLVLPDDQILYTSLTAPTGDRELTAFRIEEGLDGLTPYAVTELEYDWTELEQDRVKIAVVARETLDEARSFAAQYGFAGAGFAAMPPMERFPGVPTFELGDKVEEMAFSAEGIAFGADTFGMPEPEPEAVPEPDLELQAAPDADAPEAVEEPVDTVAARAEPKPTGADAAAEARPADQEPVTEPLATAEPADSPAPEVEPDPEQTAEQTPETGIENAALAEALRVANATLEDLETNPEAPVRPIADPTQSGPVTPIASEDPAALEAAPDEPVSDPDLGEEDLPPAPSPAAQEARQRARVIRGDAPTAATPPKPGTEAGQFTAKRGPITAPDAARGSLVGQRDSRIGLSAPGEAAPSDPAKPTMPTPQAGPALAPAGASMPRLAEQLQRVRSASRARTKSATKDKPAAPMPRVEITPNPPLGETGVTAERRPSPFDDPPPGTASEAPEAEGARYTLAGLLGRRSRASGADASGSGGGLLRRRTATPDVTETGADVAALPEEDENFTSGLLARKAVTPAGGSFRTGLILTVILLVLLAMVAIWSAVFLPNSAVARLFGLGDSTEVASGAPAPDVFTDAPQIGTAEGTQPSLADEAAADGIDLAESPEGEAVVPAEDAEIEVAAVEPEVLPDIDAELDLPPLPPIEQGENPSVEEAQALYNEDGIWARSPDRPDLRPFDLFDRVYTASIDPDVTTFDAVALPDPGVNPGQFLRRYPPPPPFGTEYDLTEDGLIAATPEGVLTPEGAFVILGQPPAAARQRPREIVEEAPPSIEVDDAVLRTFRPAERPSDLAEIRERQLLGGLTESELANRRPEERPLSPQEVAARASLFPGDEDNPDADGDGTIEVAALDIGGTDLAIARSLLPQRRPDNIAQIVASAERAPAQPETAVAPEAVAAAPSIPSNSDVSRAATERNAIRLRNVNLIGVTGTPADRRALIRLPSGRFVRVGVGDRLDGGRVAAIGETTLQYVRSGRTVTLEIPG